MKFYTHEHNDIRIIKKFALLPIQIDKEVRWFEKVLVMQEYQNIGFPFNYWDNVCFMKEEEPK